MTMENWVTQMGLGTKHLTERYAEYPAQAHDQQLYYPYDSSPPHGHVAVSKHNYSGGGHKGNAAMSALTLLAFLFFLHILQQCLKEHMTAMSGPQVMVVSAGREGEQTMAKTSNKHKLDKAGYVQTTTSKGDTDGELKNEINAADGGEDSSMTRIVTADHTPQRSNLYKNNFVHHANRSSFFDGFVSATEGN